MGLYCASASVFADEPSSALDDKPSVDTAVSAAASAAPPGTAAPAAATAEVQMPAVPSQTVAPQANPGYLYDLRKLIERSRQNIKEVNEKIKEQAVLKRNQKREERAREYYEKGLELTNEGKLDEAREYFEKAVRITEHPEMAGYIRESQKRLRREESALQAQERQHYKQIKSDENARKEDVEAAYREAVDLYKQKKYHPAKDAFAHVDEIAPGYRATDSYLKIIDQDIVLADALAVRQQAKEVERQQKEAEAARAKEKAMWLQQIEEKERDRKIAIEKQAKDVYEEAVVLYKHKKFAEAKKKFEEVSWVIPDYKETMKYLGRIDRDAEEEQKRVAKEQEKVLQEQRWEEEVERKKAQTRKEEEALAKERQHLADLEEQAQFLYKAAVRLYDHRDMDLALEKFNDIQKLFPDFKATRAYMSKIEQWKFEQEKKKLALQRSAQEEADRARQIVEQRKAEEEFKKQQALEAQDRRRQEEFQQRLQDLYKMAVSYFDRKSMDEAEQEFKNVEKSSPDYKSTREYLDRIAQWRIDQKNLQAEADKRLQEETLRLKELTGGQITPAEKQDEANRIYTDAMGSYRRHEWQMAKIRFEAVEKIVPNFKGTLDYLQRTNTAIAEDAYKEQQLKDSVQKVVVAPPLVAPVPVVHVPVSQQPVVQTPSAPLSQVTPPAAAPVEAVAAVSIEDQQRQAQAIELLAERSAQLFHQIAEIANDSSTVQTKRKMAQVDEILRNLMDTKKRLLNAMRQEASKAKQEEIKAQAEKMYQDAIDSYRVHDYVQAKSKFLTLENLKPDYRATHRYLRRIEDEQKRAEAKAKADYAKEQADHLKGMQDKERDDEEMRGHQQQQQQQALQQQEQAKQRAIEEQQQQQLQSLAQKASDINDDIIRLAREQDYEGMKAKFTELENIVIALTALKDQMGQQKAHQQRLKQFEARNEAATHPNLGDAGGEVEGIPLPLPAAHPEQFSARDLSHDNDALFKQGVYLFEHNKYVEAKLIFAELQARHDRRAGIWINKLDHVIQKDYIKKQKAEEKTREAFLADQLKAQHKMQEMEAQELAHQQKIDAEIDRQKQLEQEEHRRQVAIDAKNAALAKIKHDKEMREKARQDKIKADAEARIKAKQHEEELRAQREKDRQAKIKAEDDARAKKFEDMQKAIQEKMQKLKLEQEQERQNVFQTKAQQEAALAEERKKEALLQQQEFDEKELSSKQKEALRRLELDKKAKTLKQQEESLRQQEQENKEKAKREAEALHRQALDNKEKAKQQEEALRQEELARKEKAKQDELKLKESLRREERLRKEREAQAELDARREAVRKQLEAGVEAMYEEALSLYKQGDYGDAANKFKDVQDIMPGYKRSAQYGLDAREKSLTMNSQPDIGPATSSAPAGSRQDVVSKALDLFDPNAK